MYTVVTIGFVEDSITVNEEGLSATLRVKVLNGLLEAGLASIVELSTADDTAKCMQHFPQLVV